MSARKLPKSNLFESQLPIGKFVTRGKQITYIAPPFNPDMLMLVKERESKSICNMNFVPLYLANQLVGYNIPNQFKNCDTHLVKASKVIGKYKLLYDDNILVVTGDKKLGSYLIVPYYGTNVL